MTQLPDSPPSPLRRSTACILLVLAAATGAPQDAGASPWEQQTPYPTRFAVDGVDMVSSTEAWAVAYTDIRHTTDGGATWESQARPGADNLYSVDFFDGQHGIAVGNTTLYTRDGGATWLQASGAFGYDVEMADADLAFITDDRVEGFMRSTDGGATWSFHAMPSTIASIQSFDAWNAVASSPSGVYHTTDGGISWSLVAGGPAGGAYFTSHTHGWIVERDSAARTTDGGATWQAQALPPGSWIYDVVFSDASNGWGVGNNMVRTTNGGATWQEVPMGSESLPLWDVSFADASHGIAGGDSFLNTESVLITSNDGGETWAASANGSINDVLDIVAIDCDHAWTSHDYGGKTSRTTDGGRTWRVSEVGYQYLVLGGIDMADNLHGWTVGFDSTTIEGHVYRTNDGGASWQRQFAPGTEALRAVAALDARTAIFVGGFSDSNEQRTTDGGATWHALDVPIGAYFYDVFFLDDRTGWMVGGNGDIVKSTDGGDTWAVQSNPALYTLARVHFSDADHGWAGGYYGTLVRTTDGGSNWTAQDPQIPEMTHVLAVSSSGPTQGWISGYGGGPSSRPFVKYTTDGGASWIEHTPAVGPYDSFSALAFLNGDSGWAAGAGGIFRHGEASCIDPCAITILPAALPPGEPGVPYLQTLTASGGQPPYTFTVASGALPPGLTLTSAGVLSGTPTLSGSFTFTIAATDAAGCAWSVAYTLVIGSCAPITISPSTLGDATLGVPYSQTLTATGGTAPHTFAVTAGTPPQGLALSAAGLLSGTPTSAGAFSFTVTATDDAGCAGSHAYVLAVVSPPSFLVGQGLGQPNPNQVRLFDENGVATAVSFFAYTGSAWGVNVFAASIDGGPHDEILTGPGPGDRFGPQCRAFLRDGAPLAKVNFYAYGTLRFGVNVAGGLVDGDAFEELVTGAGPGEVFGPHVRGWNYDGAALLPISRINFFAYGSLRWGVNVASGDVDADAYAELLTGPGPGTIFGPQVRGWNHDGATTTSIPSINFNAFDLASYGVNVAGGSVDADAFAEIAASPGPGPDAGFPSRFRGFDHDGGTVAVLPGFDITAFPTVYGGRVGLGDLDGGGDAELVAGAGRDPSASSMVKSYAYTGSGMDQLPATFVPFTTFHGVNATTGNFGY